MDAIIQSIVSGGPVLALHLATAFALLVASTTLYMWLTSYEDIALVRAGNSAAAVALGGAFRGFSIPLSRRWTRPRTPEQGVLHTVVRTHLEAFLREVADRTDGAGLPRFVEDEFREFLTCGLLAEGFARFQCEGCGLDHLLPFSCKGRGFCPSCGGRRMTERAAHAVDAVLPRVPVRQWVLSLPHRLRYLLAWDHGLCRAVLAVYVRALLGFQRWRARRLGLRGGRSGSLTVIQRFGGALNTNIHFHTLVLDGVFTSPAHDGLQFHPLPSGARAMALGRDPEAHWVTSGGPQHVHLEGFDLHANVVVRGDDREGLEQLPVPHAALCQLRSFMSATLPRSSPCARRRPGRGPPGG